MRSTDVCLMIGLLLFSCLLSSGCGSPSAKTDASGGESAPEGDPAAAVALVQKLGGEVLGAPGTPSLPMIKVKLQGCEVSDEDLATIVELSGIQILKLNYTTVGDAGMVHLAKLQVLEELDLERTRVTDEGLAQLSGLKSLKQLALKGTKVTQDGIDKLKAELPGLSVEN